MDQQSLAAVQLHITGLQRELTEAKRVANSISIRLGQGPLYSDVDQPGEATLAGLRSDQFYGQGLSTAMREYLAMRRTSNLGPATPAEIHAALASGGFAFETRDPENAKRNIRISLTKNTAIFHRLPDGSHYGLAEWYPEASKRRDESAQDQEPEEGQQRKSRKAKVRVKLAAATELTRESLGSLPKGRITAKTYTPAKAAAKAPTLLDSVRRALEAVETEFTKQDVVDWIEKRHPDLKAEKRKQSVFSMISRFKDELGIEKARAGKGQEPHVFRKESTVSNGQHN